MQKELFISIRVFPVDLLYLPTKFQWSVLQIGQDSSIHIQFNSFIATSSHKKITHSNSGDKHCIPMHFYKELGISYASQHTFLKVTVTIFENYIYMYTEIWSYAIGLCLAT